MPLGHQKHDHKTFGCNLQENLRTDLYIAPDLNCPISDGHTPSRKTKTNNAY